MRHRELYAHHRVASLDCRVRAIVGTKKKHRRDAELAFWFGVNPFELTELQKIGMYANVNTCKAQQSIHLGHYDATDYRHVYALYLAAFDDEALASKARANSLEAYVDRHIKAAKGR